MAYILGLCYMSVCLFFRGFAVICMLCIGLGVSVCYWEGRRLVCFWRGVFWGIFGVLSCFQIDMTLGLVFLWIYCLSDCSVTQVLVMLYGPGWRMSLEMRLGMCRLTTIETAEGEQVGNKQDLAGAGNWSQLDNDEIGSPPLPPSTPQPLSPSKSS